MRPPRSVPSVSASGFTIVEVLVAMIVVSCGIVGVAGLFVTTIRTVQEARIETSATSLATQKMEQLHALAWDFDSRFPDSLQTDTTTDLSYDPPLDTGRGLLPSPPGTLDVNTPGYVDYVDDAGTWVGTGAMQPSGAVFVRRWSVQPFPLYPDTVLTFQVVVIPAARARLGRSDLSVRLVSAVTRKLAE